MARQQLSMVDAAWLRMEDPTNLMMVTGVLMLEGAIERDRLRTALEERLLSYPRFRQRVAQPAFGLGQPAWVDDPHFDLDAHMHHVALPQPGGKRALEAFVSDLLSTPLDFSKPLWQLHVVETEEGSVIVSRIHHCIADGIALVQVLLSLTDTSARASRRKAQPEAGNGRSRLDIARSLAESGFGLVTDPGRMVTAAGLGASAAGTLAQLTLMAPDPPTVFKGKLGVGKRAAWSEPIPLEAIKQAGARLGATINDVLITAAAGGLRRYLRSRREDVTDLEIRAAIPVNLRPLDEAHRLGNQFGLVFLSLPMGIANPRRRLAELKSRMDALKGSLQPVVAFGVLTAIGMVPSRLQPLAVEFFGSKASAVVTNVPGPRQQLYLAGRKVTRVMFWVPQSGRMGLGISILSYHGEVMLGVASDTGLVPNPEKIVSGFEAELKRLLAAR